MEHWGKRKDGRAYKKKRNNKKITGLEREDIDIQNASPKLKKKVMENFDEKQKIRRIKEKHKEAVDRAIEEHNAILEKEGLRVTRSRNDSKINNIPSLKRYDLDYLTVYQGGRPNRFGTNIQKQGVPFHQRPVNPITQAELRNFTKGWTENDFERHTKQAIRDGKPYVTISRTGFDIINPNDRDYLRGTVKMQLNTRNDMTMKNVMDNAKDYSEIADFTNSDFREHERYLSNLKKSGKINQKQYNSGVKELEKLVV